MKKLLKILMLEDLREDIGLVERVLAKDGLHFQLKGVDTREGFVRNIKEFKPDVILSDHSLPQFNSKEALKICRQKHLHVPFILVTGTVSEEFAVSCLKEGADDYVLKSKLSRLPSAIRNSLKQHKDEQKRKEFEHKLRKQNDELTKINKELDSFVYNISHNLRAPLLSAIGLLKLAKMDLNNADLNTIKLYYDKMEESVLKLDETLKEILDYSRNARSEIQNERIDLHEMIESSFDKMKYLVSFTEINKEISIEDQSSFYSDQYRLSVVLNNIISNALKYYDPNKREKWIKVNISVDEEKASIVIEDNGIGIDENCLARIFEMFYRGTEKSQGSGLGLYIVKENVDKLGGDINVSSIPEKGTRFEILIPNLAN